MYNMPRWKEGVTEFTVSVNRVGKDVKMTLPKPLDQYLKNPDKVTFAIKKSGKVMVS